MIIVLDTNIIIQSNYMMTSGKFKILLDYVEKTHSKFILPKIVLEELTAKFEDELSKRISTYCSNRKSLMTLLPQQTISEINISIEEEVKSYIEFVKKTLKLDNSDIFDYKESYLHEVIKRAIKRKRPCSDKGEEMRDAILWLSVLDLATESEAKTVAFISENTKQFAQNGSLHPDLLNDCDENNIEVKYFNSLDDFALQHATRVDFITDEWLIQTLDFNAIQEKAHDIIIDYANECLELEYTAAYHRHTGQMSSTGYFNLISGKLILTNYYIYEMADGSFRVEARLGGEFEVECEIEIVSYQPMMPIRRIVKIDYVYVYPEVSVSLAIIIRDETVESWEILPT